MIPECVTLGNESEVLRYASPAFRTHPPKLFGGELIPPEVRELYDRLWHQDLPTLPVTGHVLHEATVEGPGLVFDAAGRLVGDTIHQATEPEIATAAALIREAVGHGLRTTPGVTLLIEKAGIGNYGHWLMEMLPIAWLNRRFMVAGEWCVRMPAMNPAMMAVADESMALIGVPRTRTATRPTGPARYEQLVVMRGLTYHGIRYSPLVADALEAVAAGVEAAPPAKLWFSRRGSVRTLLEEQAICDVLSREGWLILDPGSLSFREQVSLSKGALEIAGPAGAGLTNLAFAPRGIRVTAFMPAAMPDVFFWMLAGFRQQDYREVRCAHGTGVAGTASWEDAMQLPAREALAVLLG